MRGFKYKGQKLESDSNLDYSRGFIAHIHIDGDDAPAQDLTSILEATDLKDGEEQVLIEGFDQPATPRNLRIKGGQANLAGDVVVVGLNVAGEEIEEKFTLNGTDTIDGDKAFATILEIALPEWTTDASDTVSIGLGNKLGSPYVLERDTVLSAYRNNAKESTMPTVVTDAKIEENTILLNSALNGTDIDIYLIV